MSLKAGFLIFLLRKSHFFTLKVDFIEIDALPLLFPYENKDEKRGAQAPLDLRWGKVALLFEPLMVRSLSTRFTRDAKSSSPPIYARATQNDNFLWARGPPSPPGPRMFMVGEPM